MIRAVLFDLMGTLLVEDPASDLDPGANFYRLLRDAGLDLDAEVFWAALRATPPRAVEGSVTPFEDRLMRLCAGAGLSLQADEATQLAARVCAGSNRCLALDPETRDAIASARAVGAVGLVTNYDHPPNIHLLLEREDLDDVFDVVVISGQLGVWKPDPAILHAALEPLGVAAAEAVYVGDSDVDVEAANAAGVASILVRREGGPSDPLRDRLAEQREVRPTAVIGRLAELREALETLAG